MVGSALTGLVIGLVGEEAEGQGGSLGSGGESWRRSTSTPWVEGGKEQVLLVPCT